MMYHPAPSTTAISSAASPYSSYTIRSIFPVGRSGRERSSGERFVRREERVGLVTGGVEGGGAGRGKRMPGDDGVIPLLLYLIWVQSMTATHNNHIIHITTL